MLFIIGKIWYSTDVITLTHPPAFVQKFKEWDRRPRQSSAISISHYFYEFSTLLLLEANLRLKAEDGEFAP